MSANPMPVVHSMFRGETDMARRRMQKSGWLHEENGVWKLTYREDQKMLDGKIVRARPTISIGPASGPGKLSKRQAQQIAQDHYLSKVNHVSVQPQSMATLAEFFTAKFETYCQNKLKKTTREQYFSLWRKWIEPTIGKVRLRDLTTDDVERVVGIIRAGGLSTATAGHIRKVISKMFNYAKKNRFVTGDNPATFAEMPNSQPVRNIVALSWEQARGVLGVLPTPVRQMALTSIISSMNVAELCGLQWKHINLTGEWVQLAEDGGKLDVIPPFHIAVRRHYARGEFGTLKTGQTGKRVRNIPIPQVLVAEFLELKRRPKFVSPEDGVFVGSVGKPLNENSARKRILRPAGEKFGIHNLSWHMFRHSHATFTKMIGMSDHDRQKLMGHASVEMTDRYTHEDRERMREGVERIAMKILNSEVPAVKETVQ